MRGQAAVAGDGGDRGLVPRHHAGGNEARPAALGGQAAQDDGEVEGEEAPVAPVGLAQPGQAPVKRPRRALGIEEADHPGGRLAVARAVRVGGGMGQELQVVAAGLGRDPVPVTIRLAAVDDAAGDAGRRAEDDLVGEQPPLHRRGVAGRAGDWRGLGQDDVHGADFRVSYRALPGAGRPSAFMMPG